MAVELDPLSAVLPANRAMALIKLERLVGLRGASKISSLGHFWEWELVRSFRLAILWYGELARSLH